MAVIENIATEVGDVLIISVDIPIYGLISISSFIDSVIGTTGIKYFSKEFRYSVDGINFSTWRSLTDANLQDVDPDATYTFKIEYRYTRSGTDNTGSLEFESVTLNTNMVAVSCPESYNNSLFGQFFSCYSTEVLQWCLNVLEKIYRKGILPSYIERGKNNNYNWEDRDFLDFWRTICCFFAVIVNYGRLFQNFPSNRTFLIAFLRSRGLYVCEDEDTEDLLYFMEHFYDEVRKRGTLQIAREYDALQINDDSSSSPTTTIQVNGELLRLICKAEFDEFLFAYVEPWKVGWNIDNVGPLYRGINSLHSVNKAWEDSDDVVDLSKYPLVSSGYVNYATDAGKEVMMINVLPAPGNSAGIGMTAFNKELAILVDDTIDYEITFMVKSGLAASTFMDFGVAGFTQDGIAVQFKDIVSNISGNYFFQDQSFNKDSVYYFVRGIIYSKTHTSLLAADGQLKIGFGVHLKFDGTVNTKYICPILYNKFFTASHRLALWDIKVRPLLTDGEMCFLGAKNYLLTWLKNNNLNYSTDQIEQIMRQDLLPYNLPFKNKYL